MGGICLPCLTAVLPLSVQSKRQDAMTENRPRDGFTLIEVLIVVVIIAVLAAVVIPQFTDSTTSAKESSLQHNLHALQGQIELYKLDHSGSRPAIAGDALPQLTTATDANGNAGPAGAAYPHGPYIVVMPANAFDGSDKVTAVATPGTAPTGISGTLGGWQFDETTGMIYPNHPQYY